MVFVNICVGSSCHLKGSEMIVRSFQDEIEANRLNDEVILSGSFCFGKCNREGVTVKVDEELYEGVTKDEAKSFFREKILLKARNGE